MEVRVHRYHEVMRPWRAKADMIERVAEGRGRNRTSIGRGLCGYGGSTCSKADPIWCETGRCKPEQRQVFHEPRIPAHDPLVGGVVLRLEGR